MKKPILRYLLPVAVLGLLAHLILSDPEAFSLDRFKKPCSDPIAYGAIGFDSRYGVSRAEFESAIEEAASIWNTAAGYAILASSTEPSVSINLSYDDRQRAIELGSEISSEQRTIESMKAGIDALRAKYEPLRAKNERDAEAFEKDIDAYEKDVDMWNARGGAPPGEYEKLAAQKTSLEERQAALNAGADRLEGLGRDINARVDEINALVRTLNQSADTYNAALGHDFDQGNYVVDAEGKRITIFTFETHNELVRVLTHEFGHALGIGHVENPDSIMYSYSLGQNLTLSAEDLAALKEVCEL